MSFFDHLNGRVNANIRLFLHGNFYYVSPTSLVHQVLSFNKSVIISRNFEIVEDIYNLRVLTFELRNISIVKIMIRVLKRPRI